MTDAKTIEQLEREIEEAETIIFRCDIDLKYLTGESARASARKQDAEARLAELRLEHQRAQQPQAEQRTPAQPADYTPEQREQDIKLLQVLSHQDFTVAGYIHVRGKRLAEIAERISALPPTPSSGTAKGEGEKTPGDAVAEAHIGPAIADGYDQEHLKRIAVFGVCLRPDAPDEELRRTLIEIMRSKAARVIDEAIDAARSAGYREGVEAATERAVAKANEDAIREAVNAKLDELIAEVAQRQREFTSGDAWYCGFRYALSQVGWLVRSLKSDAVKASASALLAGKESR